MRRYNQEATFSSNRTRSLDDYTHGFSSRDLDHPFYACFHYQSVWFIFSPKLSPFHLKLRTCKICLRVSRKFIEKGNLCSFYAFRNFEIFKNYFCCTVPSVFIAWNGWYVLLQEPTYFTLNVVRRHKFEKQISFESEMSSANQKITGQRIYSLHWAFISWFENLWCSSFVPKTPVFKTMLFRFTSFWLHQKQQTLFFCLTSKTCHFSLNSSFSI